MGDLEGRVHRQPLHKVGSRAIEHEIVQMGSYATLSALHNRLERVKYSHLTSFCRFSTEPGLGRPSVARQLENRAWAFARGENAEKIVDFFGSAGVSVCKPGERSFSCEAAAMSVGGNRAAHERLLGSCMRNGLRQRYTSGPKRARKPGRQININWSFHVTKYLERRSTYYTQPLYELDVLEPPQKAFENVIGVATQMGVETRR
jgi:hypothetical protein